MEAESTKKLTKLARIRRIAICLLVIAVGWVIGGWMMEHDLAQSRRVESTTFILDEDYKSTEYSIKGARATANKLSYRYTIADVEYNGSQSVTDLPAVRSRLMNGKEVFTTTGYYDPVAPYLSWIEKPDGSFASFIGYTRWAIVGLFSLAILSIAFEKKL